jgi:hypothetical protein
MDLVASESVVTSHRHRDGVLPSELESIESHRAIESDGIDHVTAELV